AAHHVDIEALRELFDFGVRMLAGFDVDAFGRANRRAHVARDAFETAVVSDGQNVGSAESLGVVPLLFGVTDGRNVSFEETQKQPAQRDAKRLERRPHGGVFTPGSFADIDYGDIDGVAASNRRHRATSWLGSSGAGRAGGIIPSGPIRS